MKMLLMAGLVALVVLGIAPAALAEHHPAHVTIPGHHQAPFPPSGEPCPLGLDEMPPGTVCGEGGSYWVPDSAAAGQYEPKTVTPTPTPTATPSATTTTTATAAGEVELPDTSGPSVLPFVGLAMLVAGGVLALRVVRL